MHRRALSACSASLVTLLITSFVTFLAGCAGVQQAERDGPGANPPPHLELIPDAEPRVELLLPGGPNKPYEVLGEVYIPVVADRRISERGLASWYGRKFHGRRTASGEPYDMYAMTAAHRTMPLPSYARVRNPVNGRQVVVRINDRGPFARDRIIDLSYTAALHLGILRGAATVEVERITNADIRAGAWRDGPRLPSTPDIADASDPLLALAAARSGWWLQVGAFAQRDGAEQLRERLARDGATPGVQVDSRGGSLHRVQAGPYASRAAALADAARLRTLLLLDAVLVEPPF